MSNQSRTNEQIVAMLAAAAPRNAAGLTPTHLHGAPTPDPWSINAILMHLRACAGM